MAQYIPVSRGRAGAEYRPEAAGMTVDQIMSKYGITSRSRASEIKIKNTPLEGDAASSAKNMVLETLYRKGECKSATALQMRLADMGLRLNLQKIVPIIWSLQKQDYVTFVERGHRKDTTNIALSKRGVVEANDRFGPLSTPTLRDGRPPATKALGGNGIKANNNIRLEGHHSIGIDPTDYRNHSTVAKGGPIERIKPLNQNEKPVSLIDETQSASHTSDGTSHTSASTSNGHANGNTPTEYPVYTTQQDLHPEDFPLIHALVQRAESIDKMTQAMKLLEESGQTEMAESLLEKIELTDLEREVLKLVG